MGIEWKRWKDSDPSETLFSDFGTMLMFHILSIQIANTAIKASDEKNLKAEYRQV